MNRKIFSLIFIVLLGKIISMGNSEASNLNLDEITPLSWTTISDGRVNGIDVNASGFSFPSPDSPSIQSRNYTSSSYLAAPLSNVDTIFNYSSLNDWTITFDRPVSNLLLYSYSWRGNINRFGTEPPTSYTFNLPFTILSGFNSATISDNTLFVPDVGVLDDGILFFPGLITSLSVISENPDNLPGGQAVAFAITAVPEPRTIVGAGTAIAFGTGFKRKLAKAKKK